MKNKVRYIDEPASSAIVEANTAKMAAWQFVKDHPRDDSSQVTVESEPSVPWRGRGIAHYRASDLLNMPAPSDEPELDFALRAHGGPEPAYILSGSSEALRRLANRLLQKIDEFSTRPNPFNSNFIFGVSVIPGDGLRTESSLSFEADPDVAKYWFRKRGIRGLWAKFGCLVQVAICVFACIGVWTVARWLLSL